VSYQFHRKQETLIAAGRPISREIKSEAISRQLVVPERASPMFLGDGELIDSEEDSPWQE
jgi:hypothetical protein